MVVPVVWVGAGAFVGWAGWNGVECMVVPVVWVEGELIEVGTWVEEVVEAMEGALWLPCSMLLIFWRMMSCSARICLNKSCWNC